MYFFKNITILISIIFLLTSCKNGKLPGADARKVPYDARERVKRNIEQGKGFRLSNMVKKRGGGDFEFASSNELWRASLDVIDFMPLSSVNYSGGIIITDWYSSEQNSSDSIKISIRFLTNEIRADALNIKVFNRQCLDTINCKITESSGMVGKELKKKILKTAALYKEENKNKKE